MTATTDSRYAFGEVFFDGSFETPMTKSKAGELADVLEAVRLAPSAVNGQPWRIVLRDDKAHFYEKHRRGFSEDGRDIRKIDMGIALCHFALAARENGLTATFEIADPGIETDDSTEYIASYTIKR